MAGTPEREKESEKPVQSSRSLHNFTLPSRLKWGRQRQLRCIKSAQSSATSRQTIPSAQHSLQSNSPIPVCRQSPITSPLSPPIEDKDKFPITFTSDSCTSEIEAVREKLMSDLRVAMDEHLKLGAFDENANAIVEEKKPAEVLPWNLRNRQAAGRGNNDSLPLRRTERGLRSFAAADGGEGSSGAEQERGKFSLALTKSEIDADFLVMTGAKAPRRPMKRPKAVQKQLDGLFPGTWLSEVSAENYKVRDVPEPKGK